MIHDSWVLEPPASPSSFAPPLHPALRSLLLRRGVATDDDYRRFVVPTIGDLHDPASIHGIGPACERIERAVRDRETILIYGDYDVDGVTSIVLLQTVLRSIGADAEHVVPHRLVDGYGLKTEVLDRVLQERAVKVVITVDCGITSIEPVRRAIEQGIDVIITDHHLPPGILPEAAAVLNPKQPGCAYPFKELAGVGVAFKLACELIRRSGSKLSIASLLKIAAIGTIADVAPLVGENRTIAWLGLHGLAEPRNPGLRALMRRLGMLGRPLRAVDIGFKIGPRINAAGRLSSAETAIDLFSAKSEEEAWSLCAELDRLNTERQGIERVVREDAERQIEGHERILVLAGEGWHKGVLGLTAGRIAQRMHRPVLMIGIDGDGAVGSARSIPTIDLHAELSAVGDLFAHFGGHEFACGFSLDRSGIESLRERLTRRFATLDETLFSRAVSVDGELTLAEIDQEFIAGHELLQPFGAGNVQPVFLLRNASVLKVRTFAEDCVELSLEDATGKTSAVLWPSVKRLASALGAGATADLLVQIEPDSYAPSGARLVVIDARPAGPLAELANTAGARNSTQS